MKVINKLKKELNCNIKKYIFYKNIKYIETNKGNYIIKKKENNNIYQQLNRYNFENYINPLYEIDDYNIYPYIEDLSVDKDEKAIDIINVISKLHNQTSYYKDISIEEITDIYEIKKNKIKELNDYYDYLRFIIEEKEIPLSSEIFLLKNISIIYICLDKTNEYLDKWYKIIKNKKSIRYSLIHNNLELNHIISNNDQYLISLEKAKYDNFIYDFITFYKKEFNNINFEKILKNYINNLNITEEELYMIYMELLMPQKIVLDEGELKNIYNLTYLIKYLSLTATLILKNNEPEKK